MIKIDLRGQAALVTGGARGLGLAIAAELADCGADVYICDILGEVAEQAAAQIAAKDVKSGAFAVNVADHGQMAEMFQKIIAEAGKLDIVINGAGIVNTHKFLEASVEEIQRLFDVNTMGVSHGCQLALQHMIPRRSGRIVNISSVAGRRGARTLPHYSASKAAAINLTQSAAYAGAEAGVTVNCICPGIIRTPMWERILDSKADPAEVEKRDESFLASVKRDIPMQRPQEAEDIAWATVFFCSEYARNITGQSLNVCGGMEMD